MERVSKALAILFMGIFRKSARVADAEVSRDSRGVFREYETRRWHPVAIYFQPKSWNAFCH